MAKLSQYEIDREANIARNRALLEELDLKQAVEDLGLPAKSKAAPKTKAKPVQSSKRAKKEKSEVEAPRRQSARLRKEVSPDPNESPSKKRKREAEIEEKRAKEAEERLEAEQRAWQAKRPRHEELELVVLANEEEAQDITTLTTTLAKIPTQPRRIGDVHDFDFDEDKQHTAAVSDLREKLQGLRVVARAKVTQDRIYSAAYHPEVTKDLIFFGDKHGQLGIWDARAPADEVADEDGDVTPAEQEEGGKYWRLQLHWPATSKSSISTVKFDPIDSHNVYTSSYDCTIRSLSFITGISREIFSTEDTLISSIDLAPTGNEMWISDALGGVTHLDLREDKTNARWYGLSNQKIGCVSVNPTNPNFILTASNNRLLKIWDTRKLSALSLDLSDPTPSSPPPSSPGPSDGSQKPTPVSFDSDVINEFVATPKGKGCLRGEWRHDKSVSSAYWDPRGTGIVSTSYDDTLRLWNIDAAKFTSSGPFPSSRPFSRINHNCQTGKWLTILKAQWSPNPEVYPHFTIGNMNHSLDIFSSKGDLITRLSDSKRITAVQAVTCSHPSVLERAASGNGSGRCVLWAPENLD